MGFGLSGDLVANTPVVSAFGLFLAWLLKFLYCLYVATSRATLLSQALTQGVPVRILDQCLLILQELLQIPAMGSLQFFLKGS